MGFRDGFQLEVRVCVCVCVLTRACVCACVACMYLVITLFRNWLPCDDFQEDEL